MQLGPHDLLIMMRPTGLAANSYQPLQKPLVGDLGGWDPKQYKRRREAPTGVIFSHPAALLCSLTGYAEYQSAMRHGIPALLQLPNTFDSVMQSWPI